MRKKLSGLSLLALCSALLYSQEGSWRARQDVVEKLSARQPGINYYEERVPRYVLPDPLISSEGKVVKNPKNWTKVRRHEILELFRKNVYGRVPPTPYEKTFTLINEDRNAMDGNATLKQVVINITSGEKTLDINLTLFIPNKVKKPVPAFLLINNRGPENIDPTRELKSEFWPAEEGIDRGYAMAVFYNKDIDPDNFDDFKNGIHGVLDQGRRNSESWATIAAWAWGASRCLDYLVTDKDIAAGKVAVVGHSRGGKTALWAGAEDQRFAMVISNESGCGGAALARRRFGETVERINTVLPHWFCTNFRTYNNNENALPVDQHMLISLAAPRPVYVACADEDLWGDPKGSYLALFNAVPVYRLFNKEQELPSEMPALDKQVIKGRMGFHIRSGGHNMLLEDWNRFFNFSDRFLK
jgi:dienelactone hydrolase